MTTNFVVAGRGDLDTLFKARTSSPISATGFAVAGVDLNQRYEPRGSTTAIANTGFRSGANDLAQLFMDIAAASNTINIDNRTVSAHNTGSAGIASYSARSSSM